MSPKVRYQIGLARARPSGLGGGEFAGRSVGPLADAVERRLPWPLPAKPPHRPIFDIACVLVGGSASSESALHHAHARPWHDNKRVGMARTASCRYSPYGTPKPRRPPPSRRRTTRSPAYDAMALVHDNCLQNWRALVLVVDSVLREVMLVPVRSLDGAPPPPPPPRPPPPPPREEGVMCCGADSPPFWRLLPRPLSLSLAT